jgi:hypothetical protein
MIEVTDAEQVERLNSRVMELLRERDALVKALKEAERFMTYFAGEQPYHFDGPGTPTSCLAQIRYALEVVANSPGDRK